MFIDCIFRSRIKTLGTEAEQYLTKEGGQIALIDCCYETAENVPVRVDWTKYPLPSLKCYQYGVVQNGKPVILGGGGSEETVQLQGKKALEAYVFEYEAKRYINIENLLGGSEGWNPLGEPEISKKAGKLRIPTFMQLQTDREKLSTEKMLFMLPRRYSSFPERNAGRGLTFDWRKEIQFMQN